MNTTTDKTTLKNIKGRTAPFLLLNAGRPEIGPVGQSDIFSRLKNFLPELADANDQLPVDAQLTEAIQIENVVAGEDSSSSDSEDTDYSSDSDSDSNQEVDTSKNCVQIDVNLFKDPAPIEEGDPAIENVVELPEGFRDNGHGEEQKKKMIVEELS
ncbi:unnamed protein product [Auanema sp. JU1783]|nr:unnamed protein product [Auanema sp. JU1783]